jgi:glycosyltransferase involved in cell wall biosynthesis
VNDVKAAYNSFNIATLSSSFGEGFPNAVGEAMACGTPVVATDIGDARWIIGEFGEVVPPGNPDLLCAGWTRLRMRLVRDSGLREATRGAIVANYGVDAMLGRTETILSQLVAGRAAADLSRDLA